MKPVKQTDRTSIAGDCFRACVASILEYKIEDVPNFVHESDNWLSNLTLWALERRHVAVYFQIDSYKKWMHNRDNYITKYDLHYVLTGKSPRCTEDNIFYHSTVWYDGSPVHDPYTEDDSSPELDCILNPIIDAIVLYPIQIKNAISIPK